LLKQLANKLRKVVVQKMSICAKVSGMSEQFDVQFGTDQSTIVCPVNQSTNHTKHIAWHRYFPPGVKPKQIIMFSEVIDHRTKQAIGL